jgi:hypothetical protein
MLGSSACHGTDTMMSNSDLAYDLVKRGDKVTCTMYRMIIQP